jgi:hypothetical protein
MGSSTFSRALVRREQIEALENETDLAPSHEGKLIAREARHFLPRKPVGAGCRMV